MYLPLIVEEVNCNRCFLDWFWEWRFLGLGSLCGGEVLEELANEEHPEFPLLR